MFRSSKTKRRVLVLSVAGLVLCITAVSAFAVRRSMVNKRILASRAEGIVAFNVGDYEAALHKIGTYVQRHPDDADSLYMYAQCRMEVEDPDGRHVREAIGIYRQMLSLRPNHDGAKHKLLDIYVRAGLNAETLKSAASLLKVNPADAAALRANTVALARLHRLDEASVAAEAHHKVAPLDYEMHGLSLQLLMMKHEPAATLVGYASKLHEKHGEHAELDLISSAACAMTGDQTGAKKWALAAAAKNVKEPVFVSALAGQLDSVGLYDDALRVLEAASEGGDVLIRSAMSMRLIEAGKFDDAADRLKSLDPANKSAPAELIALRALALAQSGRKDQATPLIDALATRKERVALAWAPVLRTVFLTEPADDKAIIQACDSAIARAGENSVVWMFQGDAYAHVGESEMAIECWRRAAITAPAWSKPATQLARTLVDLGRYDQAIQVGRAARIRSANDSRAAAVLADAIEGRLHDPATADPKLVSEFDAIIADLEKLDGDREDLVAYKARSLLVKGQKVTAAKSITDAVIASNKSLGEPTLLRLAAISRQGKLNCETVCFDRSAKLNGETHGLAFARARLLQMDDKGAEGVKLVEAGRSDPRRKGDAKGWDEAYARFLDDIGDERAKGEWIRLADANASDVSMQWKALTATSVQKDPEFLKRVVERLHAGIGERGTNWKMAKARLLLANAPAERDLLEAAGLLGEITRTAPALLTPRLVLSNCLQALGNVNGAVEQLTIAADMYGQSSSLELKLAGLLYMKGDYNLSVDRLQRLSNLENITFEEREAAADLLLRQGQAARAMALLNGGSEGKTIRPSVVLISAYLQSADVAKAEAMCAELLKHPTEAQLEFIAAFYASQGKKAEAQAALARLDEVSKTPGTKELIRGAFQAAHGDPKVASEQLQLAAKLAPSNPVAWRRLIQNELSAGRAGEAIAFARQAATAVPSRSKKDFAPLLQNVEVVQKLSADSSCRTVLVALLDPNAASAALDLIAVLKNESSAKRDLFLSGIRTVADRNPQAYAVQVYVISRFLKQQQTWVDADRLAKQAMQTFQSEPLPAELAYRSAFALGHWTDAIQAGEQLRKRVSLNPRNADMMLATAAIENNDGKSAIARLQPYMKEGSSDDALQSLYGRALVHAGQQADAGQMLVQTLHRSAAWRASWIGIASRELPNKELAVDWLNQAESCIPADDTANERLTLAIGWNNLAKRFANTDIEARAMSIRLECNKHFDDAGLSMSVHLAMAMLNDAAGDLPNAEMMYRKVLAESKGEPIVQNNLAMVLVKRGEKFDEALSLASSAASVDGHPKRANFRETLATVQSHLKQYNVAVRSLREALADQPDNAEWRIALADVLSESGNVKEARIELKGIDAAGIANDKRLSAQYAARLESLRRKLGSNVKQAT